MIHLYQVALLAILKVSTLGILSQASLPNHGDYCPEGTIPQVICEDDWSCPATLAILARGEDTLCWLEGTK